MTRDEWVAIHTTGVFLNLARFAGGEHIYYDLIEKDFNYDVLFHLGLRR